MKKHNIYSLMISCLLLCSCSNWLEIDPEDRIMEENLFETRDEFMVALNGVYIEMSSTTLYGGNMLAGLFDVLAQYYTAAMPSDHAYIDYADFEYEEEAVKKTYQDIWEKYYNLIVNCNTIIEHCDQAEAMLGESYYPIIKGEALALRAFFHFEILRIWGPVFKENREMECMPYAESAKIEVRPLLTAEVVYEKLKTDLKAAEALLAGSDPVIAEGPLFSAAGYNESNSFRYRNLRMNYYAVQALLAKVALWCGDTSLALEYARKVLSGTQEEGNEKFPFITRGEQPEDRIYQSELLFAHYNVKRVDIYKNYFSNSLADASVLRIDEDDLNDMYEETDYRLKNQWVTLKNPSDKEQMYFVKYREVAVSSSELDKLQKEYRYLVPMLRVSEMYYIIAECESNSDEALRALNKVRNARALKDLSDATLIQEELAKEYKREFIGEGQLFFYYKRLGIEKIVYDSGSWFGGYVNMSTAEYVPPLPDSEKNNRVY